MSFGFSVGDFLAVAKLAKDIWQKLHGSVGEFATIRDEVNGYSSLLHTVSMTVPNHGLAPEQTEGLAGSAQACRSVLEDLQKLVDKYRRLTSEAHGITANVRQKAKQLQWDPDEARDLRARITSTTTILRGLCEAIARDQQARRELCQWLSPLDFPAQQRGIYSRLQPGSGQWLLQSARFGRWLDSEGGVLLCPGDPGAGKTVLASVVIDHLWNRPRPNGIGVAYIYCDYLKAREQTHVHLVGSLLKQLVEQRNPVSESLKSYYDEHRSSNIDQKPEGAFDVLKAECDNWSRIYIVIDALDECSEKDDTRRRVIAGLLSLQRSNRINVLVTSRPIPSILCDFEVSERLEIRADPEDIHRYLLGQMDRFSKRILAEKDLQAQIISKIIDAADGMFLLARLTFDTLVGHKTLKAIKGTLDKLSKGASSLDSAYDDTMKRIEDQGSDDRDLAKKTLLWISQSQRSLSVAEMQQAVAIELGESDLDPDNTVDCDDIISACAGLVTRGRESHDRDILRLVHYTTQEYLERTKTKYFPSAQEYLASSCLTYLLLDVFSGAGCPLLEHDVRSKTSDTGVGHAATEKFCSGCKNCQRAEQHKEHEKPEGGLKWALEWAFNRQDPCTYLQKKQYPFYEYALWYWGHHSEKCDDEAIRILTKTFLDDSMRVSDAYCHIINDRPVRVKFEESNRGSAMQLAAFLGLTKVVSKRLEDGFEPDVKDWSGQTPLFRAVDGGHEEVVRLLLTREDVNLNVRDLHGQTPLIVAVRDGNKAIVQLLLTYENIDINVKDLHRDWSALVFAMMTLPPEDLRIMKLLLACDDIEVNIKDREGRTPLIIALVHENIEGMQLLLAHGDIQVDKRSYKGQTALHVAAREGRTEAMRLLLAHGDIHVNIRDHLDQTALYIAAREDRTESIRLLLAHEDIQVNVRHALGSTALHVAAEYGKFEAVQLLLARDDLEVNATDHNGESALFRAVRNASDTSNLDVAMLFLARGDVDLNIRDKFGRAPLYYAVHYGHLYVVQLLLTREDLEISIEDGEGGGLLSLAEDERDKAKQGMESDAYNAIISLLRSYFQQRSSNTTSTNLRQQIPQRLAHTNDDDD